ncbi:ubiquitin-like small modifier protein 1 [Streptomyces sp. A1136]|uniref:ubiquitin-like small modifier protein 1 n=1 Tax=Streptomyces sp. A1136 TaxID=2563102 RepID=UPI00109E9DA4|nr:ubiquitin-like small modifier protein 1 [Streptomyces sp. A1136]THA53232.1 MoaD/ThiS family protein [Streptomyces sp. A1136]
MAVSVSIPTILRTCTGGEKTVTGEGATLGELIDDLERQYPGLKQRLVKEGDLHRFVDVYINDEHAKRDLNGLQTALKDGDDVALFPAVAGG